MFTGFNLTGLNADVISDYTEIGETIFARQKKSVQKELDSFILKDGSIDGTALQNDWFPQVEADIFLSHSHGDEKLIMALAGMLKEKLELTTFIDSCVWGYAGDLLKKIDDEYCLNDKGDTYDYVKRNYSTSHIHMMLSTALTKMMDKTECLIFVNTPNSITTGDVVKNKTKSPWIYSEIAMSYLLRKKKPERHKNIKKSMQHEIFNFEKLDIAYDVKLDHLNPLSIEDLDTWMKACDKDRLRNLLGESNTLDILYDIKGLIEFKRVPAGIE